MRRPFRPNPRLRLLTIALTLPCAASTAAQDTPSAASLARQTPPPATPHLLRNGSQPKNLLSQNFRNLIRAHEN